jgi:hypothetical protein
MITEEQKQEADRIVEKLTYEEFLNNWNKKNNPFYPNDMRWDIQTTHKVLKEYDEYLSDFNSTLFIYTLDELSYGRDKIAIRTNNGTEIRLEKIGESTSVSFIFGNNVIKRDFDYLVEPVI